MHGISVMEADASVASAGGGLDTISERERADLSWTKRVDITRDRKVGSQKLDIVCRHEFKDPSFGH
jgi:hypothetical protein